MYFVQRYSERSVRSRRRRNHSIHLEQVTSHDDDSGGAACSDAYSVGGLAYDANSNLTRLVRWGPALFAGGDGAVQGGRGAWADALTYRYADGTNRLVRLDEYEDPALDGTPSENPSGHEHSAGYAGRFDYDAAGRVTRERVGQSGPAVRRQVKRYSAASLPVRLDVPAVADPAHGGVRLEYRYDGAGQRVQEFATRLCSSPFLVHTEGVSSTRRTQRDYPSTHVDHDDLSFWPAKFVSRSNERFTTGAYQESRFAYNATKCVGRRTQLGRPPCGSLYSWHPLVGNRSRPSSCKRVAQVAGPPDSFCASHRSRRTLR